MSQPPEAYPALRVGSPPTFLGKKYNSVDGLLDTVEFMISREAEERERDESIGEHRGGLGEGADELADQIDERLDTTAVQIDRGKFIGSFGTFDDLFHASAAELESALQGSPKEIERQRVIIQRLLVWEDIDEVEKTIDVIFDRVIGSLPHNLNDIELLDDADLIDPFMVSFSSKLLHDGEVSSMLRGLVIHKCMMKLEDMIGNLHQETLARAAGGDRVAEPQGVIVDGAGGKKRRDKDTLHPTLNPYPGADARKGQVEFYQIKNKTGSAKGSDGEKLGRQFLQLKKEYPVAKRFYVSIIGKTLKGHRSKGGFLKTDGDAEVLVGLTAIQQLGGHRDTPDILLDLYLERFAAAMVRNKYDLNGVLEGMVAEWKNKHGNGDPVRELLRATIIPNHPYDQSSKTYDPYGRGYDDTRDLF